MSFPRLAPLSLSTDDLSQCVPGTEHSLASVLAALRSGSARFAAMEKEDGGIRLMEAKSIDGQGLMSTIFRIHVWLGKGGRHFDAILKITTTRKLEQLKPLEIAALKKANGLKAMEKVWGEAGRRKHGLTCRRTFTISK